MILILVTHVYSKIKLWDYKSIFYKPLSKQGAKQIGFYKFSHHSSFSGIFHNYLLRYEAAKLMISNRISGLPVINAKHHPIGIITKTDILKSTFSQ
jgi:hypothetical protein